MKRNILSAAVLFFMFSVLFIQPHYAQDSGKKVRTEAEVMPQYIGGDQALNEMIIREFKYPEEAKKAGIQGKVIVGFIVDKQGNVKDAQVKQGIGYGCDDEALRMVRKLKFKPGMDKGKPVDVEMALPFQFKLQ